MIPMAPTSVMAIPPSSKPKIGFSIDSIVGTGALNRQSDDCNLSPRSESSDRPSSSFSDYNYPLELRNNDLPKDYRLSDNYLSNKQQIELRNSRIQQMMSQHDFQKNYNTFSTESPTNCHDLSSSSSNVLHKSTDVNNCNSPMSARQSVSPDDSVRNMRRTPTSPLSHNSQSPSKGPIVVPGIPAGLIRPFPVQPPSLGEIKSLPRYMSTPEMVGSPSHHFLAAQFQMAAAIAHGQTGQGFPPGAGLPQHHHAQFNNPNMVRDSYPLYPWLLSRHGRIFPHRFPGSFLLQPFRKPKRVRTAFSPSQLLKLEHAFESNHYVVGAERKTLAQALSLTETQVKVWFQNRRTKHKRMQQEEDAKGGGHNNCNGSNSCSSSGGGCQRNQNGTNNGGDISQISYDDDDIDEDDVDDDDDVRSEDELIDMDDCPSDQEGEFVG